VIQLFALTAVLKWNYLGCGIPNMEHFMKVFNDFIAKSPPDSVSNNKVFGYSESYEQPVLLN